MIFTVKKTPRNILNFRNIIVSLKCRKKKDLKNFFWEIPIKIVSLVKNGFEV